jgi:hypothetical protein
MPLKQPSSWRLRSPDNNNDNNALAGAAGGGNNDNNNVEYPAFAVRPDLFQWPETRLQAKAVRAGTKELPSCPCRLSNQQHQAAGRTTTARRQDAGTSVFKPFPSGEIPAMDGRRFFFWI